MTTPHDREPAGMFQELDELRRDGRISEDEYAQKRREILGAL